MPAGKHLLPQVERFFKANLHTHSTISDGKLTPEEVKEGYKALGYQILCLTDHNTTADLSAMRSRTAPTPPPILCKGSAVI